MSGRRACSGRDRSRPASPVRRTREAGPDGRRHQEAALARLQRPRGRALQLQGGVGGFGVHRPRGQTGHEIVSTRGRSKELAGRREEGSRERRRRFGVRRSGLGHSRRELAEIRRWDGGGAHSPEGRKRYKPNTIRSYDRAVRVHIAPSKIGDLKVSAIQRSDLQDFADELLTLGLSVGTVSNILNPIQAFCRRAVDRGELAVNPAEGIDLPNSTSQRPARIASAAEATALLAALRPEDRPVWATAFYAGLRRGELQALRCCDLDFKANLIRVERGWDQEEGLSTRSPDPAVVRCRCWRSCGAISNRT
ncbi:MAG TPA: hypothetical protein VFG58_10615 [Solirubrobacterales bacterium]|nr:hypothetical protein [Solirubrobacterales bacterium]